MTQRLKTIELNPGDVVATTGRGVGAGYVFRATPTAQVLIWRQVEDVTTLPRDHRDEPDRLVFFADGTKAEATATQSWLTPEA